MAELDFAKAVERMKDFGYIPNPDLVYFNRAFGAREMIRRGIEYFVGNGNAKWMPQYDEIAEWLEYNDGRGLLCFGDCGLGKTLVCGKILPLLINHTYGKVVVCYDCKQLNRSIDEMLSKKLIYLDDVGVENESVKYGERRQCFAELVDEAEKKGKLLILTTNLSIEQLEEKYGRRTVDRLRAITKTVLFEGKSMRV